MERILSGEFDVTLDEAGRISLPRRLREIMEKDKVVLTKGADICLWLFIAEDWKEEVKKIVASTNRYSASDRDIRRRYIGPAHELEIDKQGRILIASPLREFAGLVKDCYVVGQYDYLEIWDNDKYKSCQRNENEMKERSEELSNKLRGNG
ncbi:MAG: division/cell wall cluster transcriptional repressor MraZ [Treponema sp.]|nr:division/cell wall cluster transcriptional repressor MraZ [Treponema sp.]